MTTLEGETRWEDIIEMAYTTIGYSIVKLTGLC
jgi:hypothetical protein